MQLRITVGVLLFEERQVHCEGDIQREHNRVGCPSSVFCGEHVNIRGPVNLADLTKALSSEGVDETDLPSRAHYGGHYRLIQETVYSTVVLAICIDWSTVPSESRMSSSEPTLRMTDLDPHLVCRLLAPVSSLNLVLK